MQEHEARVRAFYDHEVEEPRANRRRRQVADWGVGEDVFDRMPSRRFSRAEGAHARHVADGPPTREHPPATEGDSPADAVGDSPVRVRGESPDEAPGDSPDHARGGGVAPGPDAPSHAARRTAPRRAVPRGRTDDGRRTIVIGEPRDEEVALAVDGRRTVVIGARRAQTSPRRPPRTGAERVGPRPDRIVAYAVALGLLLIVIAILSAGH